MGKENFTQLWKKLFFISDALRGEIVDSSMEKSLYAELTLAQARTITVMRRLRDNYSGEITLKKLASEMSVSSAAASEIVDVLIKRGLLTRSQSEIDRRAVRLDFTEIGRSKIIDYESVLSRFWMDFTAKLSESDRKTLSVIFDKILSVEIAKPQ